MPQQVITNRHNGRNIQPKEGDVMSKYSFISKKGEGTFSEVFECKSLESNQSVAIKKLKARYDNLNQVSRIREVHAMQKLCNHSNILKLRDVIFEPRSSHLYLILELMDMNLYEYIRGRKQLLAEKKVRFFMLQLVDAVLYMHKSNIFHRDIKPENILVKGDVLKLADFGSCRRTDSKQPYTEYISTRWYRAPECLLTDGYYDLKMDIWSVGCVFYEISRLTPIFPGQNEIDQLDRIHRLLGTPTHEVLSKFIPSRSMKFQFPHRNRDEKTWNKLTSSMPIDGVDLLRKFLDYDPTQRISMSEARSHIYIKSLNEELSQKRRASRQNSERKLNEKSEERSQNMDAASFPTMANDMLNKANMSDQKMESYYNFKLPILPHNSSITHGAGGSNKQFYKKQYNYTNYHSNSHPNHNLPENKLGYSMTNKPSNKSLLL